MPTAGTVTDGIGTHRSLPTHSSRGTESSTIRSAGASTPLGWRMERRILATASATDMVAATTITSDPAIILSTLLVLTRPGPLGTRIAFVAAQVALALAAVSAAVDSAAPVALALAAMSAAVDSAARVADSAVEAVASMAVADLPAAEVSTEAAEADTAASVHQVVKAFSEANSKPGQGVRAVPCGPGGRRDSIV